VKNAEKGGKMRSRKAQTAITLSTGLLIREAVGFIARRYMRLEKDADSKCYISFAP
jgi:hypothetical protein